MPLVPSQRRGYVEVDGGQVHYREQGHGAPVVLLHQSPNSSMMYERAYEALARAGYRAIGLDTPGFGLSDPPGEQPSVGEYAGWLAEAIVALGLAGAALVGHHTGAAIAAEIAADRPEVVSALVLCGLPFYSSGERAARQSRRSESLELRTDGSHLTEIWRRRVAATPGWTDLHAMHRGVMQTLIAGPPAVFGHRAAYAHDMAGALRAIVAPTLILTHPGDDLLAQSRRAAELRPDFAYAELAESTHDVVDEQPDAFVGAIVTFLAGTVPAVAAQTSGA